MLAYIHSYNLHAFENKTDEKWILCLNQEVIQRATKQKQKINEEKILMTLKKLKLR